MFKKLLIAVLLLIFLYIGYKVSIMVIYPYGVPQSDADEAFDRIRDLKYELLDLKYRVEALEKASEKR